MLVKEGVPVFVILLLKGYYVAFLSKYCAVNLTYIFRTDLSLMQNLAATCLLGICFVHSNCIDQVVGH